MAWRQLLTMDALSGVCPSDLLLLLRLLRPSLGCGLGQGGMLVFGTWRWRDVGDGSGGKKSWNQGFFSPRRNPRPYDTQQACSALSLLWARGLEGGYCYAQLPTLHVLILANMFSASSRRNFRWNPSRAARHGFYAMMTHVLSFPIQARGIVQRNLEEVPRSILPVRLLSCHYRMDLLPLGISGTLGSNSDTLGSDSGTFISVHVLTASRLISPSRFMFSVLCLTTYVLCFTASLGTSGTFTSELRSVLVYIACLVLVNYSVCKLLSL